MSENHVHMAEYAALFRHIFVVVYLAVAKILRINATVVNVMHELFGPESFFQCGDGEFCVHFIL